VAPNEFAVHEVVSLEFVVLELAAPGVFAVKVVVSDMGQSALFCRCGHMIMANCISRQNNVNKILNTKHGYCKLCSSMPLRVARRERHRRMQKATDAGNLATDEHR
jgi:hypothetical protein